MKGVGEKIGRRGVAGRARLQVWDVSVGRSEEWGLRISTLIYLFVMAASVRASSDLGCRDWQSGQSVDSSGFHLGRDLPDL